MNKKITIICSMVLSAAFFTTGVYASKTLEFKTETETAYETEEIQTAVDDSAVLRSRYNIVSSEDDIVESENNTVQVYGINEKENDEESLSATDAIKVYNVVLSEKTISLAEQLTTEAGLRLLPNTINEDVSYAFMKKGQSVEDALEKINGLDISDERKEKMILRATEKAGKWYVSCVKKYSKYADAAAFVNPSSIEDLLEENSISNVKEMKYTYINNSDMLAIWIRTDNAEYVIPFVTIAREDNLSSNKVYTLNEFVNYIVK